MYSPANSARRCVDRPECRPYHRDMQIVAVANQKGGVGKTTTAWTLGAALAERGRAVLCVDLDPQASLTAAAGLEAEGRSMAEVLAGTLPLAAIVQDLGGGLYLAPSDIALADAELRLIAQPMGRERALAVALEGLSYDYALIDCPPSLGILTINALTAADAALIPTTAEYLALRGLAHFYRTLDQVRRFYNPGLVVLGVLVTFLDPRLLHAQEVLAAMEAQGLPVLPMQVRRSVRLAEAAVSHEPLLTYDPANPSTEAYRALAERIDA